MSITPTIESRIVHLESVTIAGVPFVVEYSDGKVELKNEVCQSLGSYALTLQDAIDQMIAFLPDILRAYAKYPKNQLSDDARTLQDYLIEKMTV